MRPGMGMYCYYRRGEPHQILARRAALATSAMLGRVDEAKLAGSMCRASIPLR